MVQTKKQGKSAFPPIESKLTAFALGAIIAGGGIATSQAEAQTTITNASGFNSALTGATNGETVTISSGVTEIDLNGISSKITASNVTLQGAASFDLGAAIRAQAGSLLGTPDAVRSRGSLDPVLNSLTNKLLDNLPTTNIYNSAATTGTHAGISAPAGGFSLKSLTFKGTVANIDSASGASKYMGLVASTFDRYDSVTDPNDGQGMKRIENMAFVDNVVHSTGAVHNVGNNIFFSQRRYNGSGTYVSGADRIETLDAISGSAFIGNKMYSDMTASVGNRDVGGGGAGWVNLTSLDSTIFANNLVQGHHAFGAGLFTYSLGNVDSSIFYNNIIESDHDAYGGGLMSSGGIDSIANSVFVGNEARGLDFGLGRSAGVLGGAISSTAASNFAQSGVNREGIGSITNSLFAFNRVFNETGEEANGGAVNVARRLNQIQNTVFYGNVAESTTGEAFGGAMAVNVNLAGMATTITDSRFLNNTVKSGNGDGGGGAISFGTTTAAATTYTLNLAATAGGLTDFSGNTFNGRANSLYFGKVGTVNPNQTNITVNIKADAGGTVALLDPIKVDLDNGKTFTLVNHDTGGRFIWDGVNDLSASGGGSVTLESGSSTIFEKGFHLHNAGSGNAINVDVDNGANLTMMLTGRNKNMALFEDAAIIGATGANLSAVYQGFADYNGSWLLSEATTAQGMTMNTSDTVDSVTGAKTSVNLTANGGQTWVNMRYSGPAKSFAAAGPNANQGRQALQDAWENIILRRGFSSGAQTAYYHAILGELDNYTAEAFASQGTVALSSSYWIANQALSSNNRSWFADHGSNAPASGDYDGTVRLWADYIGSRIDQDSRDGYSGYDVHNNGAAFGFSYDAGRIWTLGAYFALSDGETTYDDIQAEIDTDIVQGGLFAAYKSDSNGFGATFDLAYAALANDSTRRFIGDRYTGSFDQSVFSLGLTTSYEFNPWENGRLTPYLALRYQHLDQDAVRETSPTGLMPLHVKSTDGNAFTSVLGVNLEHNFYINDTVFTPSLNAGWRHEFGDRDIATRYDIAGASLVTQADSLDKAANAFDVGASFTLVPLKHGETSFGINGGYNASISSDRLEHSFYGGLEIKF